MESNKNRSIPHLFSIYKFANYFWMYSNSAENKISKHWPSCFYIYHQLKIKTISQHNISDKNTDEIINFLLKIIFYSKIKLLKFATKFIKIEIKSKANFEMPSIINVSWNTKISCFFFFSWITKAACFFPSLQCATN